jgi:heat shock protein HslJ
MNRLLIFVILFSIWSNGAAQDPDPDLFQTWYLTYVRASDLDTPIFVTDVVPPVSPYITISEDLTIIGDGPCNSFEASFEHLGTNYMSNLEFSSTTLTCEFGTHIMLENTFFGIISIGWPYEINLINGGLELRMTTPIDGLAIYQNYPLSTSDISLNTTKIYPNPSQSKIYISSDFNPIQEAVLYNIIGEKILTKTKNLSEIDISKFVSGIYILRLETKRGFTTHKIIKTNNQ